MREMGIVRIAYMRAGYRFCASYPQAGRYRFSANGYRICVKKVTRQPPIKALSNHRFFLIYLSIHKIRDIAYHPKNEGIMDDKDDLEKQLAELTGIEAEEAKKAGKIAYMARALVQATLPHKETAGGLFKRRNGLFELSIMSPNGLPYGSIPRLLLSWVTTEAFRTRSPFLVLGASLSAFMAELHLAPTGGKHGAITRFVKQTERLFSSAISYRLQNEHISGTEIEGGTIGIADKYNLWWQPKKPAQMPIWKSSVTLSQQFFNEIIERPVPVDMDALMALKRSPLALDIYCWITYRLSYLQKDALIPWELLQMQFGADYAKDARGLINFKRMFLLRLKDVLAIYDTAKAYETEKGLFLKPSPPHVAKRLIPEVAGSRKRLLPAAIAAAEDAHTRTAEDMTAFLLLDSPPVRLKLDTFEKAKAAAPGLDIYYLEAEWREWIEKKGERPKNPDAAFIGFCRRKARKI